MALRCAVELLREKIVDTLITNKPWYRERWLWLVLAPLFFVFFVCSILITAAIKYGDDVVTDDYYKEGRLVNHHFAAEAAAVDLGVEVELILNKVDSRFELELNQPLSSDDTVKLELSHPVESDFDLFYVLKRKSLRGYYADLNSLPEGRWYVRIEGSSPESNELNWRLSSEVDFNQTSKLSLQ